MARPIAYATIGGRTGGNILTLKLLPALLGLLLAREAAAITSSNPLTDEEPGGMALNTLELNNTVACGK